MIEIGQLKDGRLMLASNEPFPADLLRVEYYREQHLFMLVYEEGADHPDDLMPCEIPPYMARKIESSADVMVVAMAENGQEPYGYQVPLVQVGV